MDTGKLYIVATPIGNLSDTTFRAIETLKQVDVILCEDTRVTKKLLDHFEIKKKLVSYHQHSNAKKVNEIKEMLLDGKNLALVTDAGTPGISDPGNMLINEILTKDITTEIIPIPGASAVATILSVSGFPTDKFVFMGFPPHKNKRQKYFKEVASSTYTVVFYESCHRIKKCLEELKNYLREDQQIIVGRELTKLYETIYRGTATEVLEAVQETRGEFVIAIRV